MKDEPRSHPFRDSEQDIEAAKRAPDTPQTLSPAYRLAFADRDFMTREELRPVRLQLELLKPQMIMDERGIESTVVMFGGARIPAPEQRQTARTQALADLSHYYDEARRFARMMTERSLETYGRNWVICTGGGPGVMEAGNRGADDAGGLCPGAAPRTAAAPPDDPGRIEGGGRAGAAAGRPHRCDARVAPSGGVVSTVDERGCGQEIKGLVVGVRGLSGNFTANFRCGENS